MTVKDDLIAAKALIATPEKWIKGEFERDGCFCARGAIQAVNLDSSREIDAEEALEAAVPRRARHRSKFVSSVSKFNDDPNTTHADIMALFDRAIARAA